MFSLAIIATIASFAPVALSAPAANARQDVSINIQYIKATSETDISVTDKTTSEALGYACSSKLSTGAFADFSVSADINENGAGNLTIGPDTYIIHEDPKFSGGISCFRMYNLLETLVRCTTSIPASMAKASSSKIEVPNCFSEHTPVLHRSAASQENQVAAPEPRDFSLKPETRPIDSRQLTCTWYEVTTLVGDGNPHQNFLDKQLSVSSNQSSH
jgi:hypothetical protein